MLNQYILNGLYLLNIKHLQVQNLVHYIRCPTIYTLSKILQAKLFRKQEELSRNVH